MAHFARSSVLANRPIRRKSWLSSVFSWLNFRRQQRHLARLEDHILDDIGLTRSEALEESRRIEWDVPGHWRS